uniref:S-adenosyl-L-methionine-dependent methyltransferase n=1 Tax=Mycena chlorophos TaxID=658473 RepID=A0ABQ0LW28_MYCCL|nr:S-adenosyl-L-methionine-dependent methyltransferase [Mycena chlorophos]
MESGEVDFKTTGRALVPGCGGGYDAIYLGTLGFETTGLDISPTALEIARQRVPEGVNVQFEQHDFFSLKVFEEEKFDLVYDYTFFCAIPRNLHAGWGSQMRQLVKPGGYLITLVFPIVPEPDILNGPPWPVRPSLYDEPLQGPQGGEWEKVVDRVPNTSVPGHIDHEHLIVWRKL